MWQSTRTAGTNTGLLDRASRKLKRASFPIANAGSTRETGTERHLGLSTQVLGRGRRRFRAIYMYVHYCTDINAGP